MIGPPLMRILKKKHAKEIECDAEDLMYSFFGNLAHYFIENIKDESVLYKEQRLFVEVGGWTLSGQFDLIYKDKNGVCLADVKFTSRYAVQDGVKKDWERQLNVYRWMLNEVNTMPDNDIDNIDRLEIIAPIRDAGFIDDKLQVFPVKKYKLIKVKEFVEKRIAFHRACDNEMVEKVPECTAEERWCVPDKFAVCPGPGKKSVKNHDTRAAAEAHAATKRDYVVEVRHGENKRCSRFCNVSEFCWWWKDYKDGYITDSYTGKVPKRLKYK